MSKIFFVDPANIADDSEWDYDKIVEGMATKGPVRFLNSLRFSVYKAFIWYLWTVRYDENGPVMGWKRNDWHIILPGGKKFRFEFVNQNFNVQPNCAGRN